MTNELLARPSDPLHGRCEPDRTRFDEVQMFLGEGRICTMLPTEQFSYGTKGAVRVRRTFKDEGGNSKAESDKKYGGEVDHDTCDGTCWCAGRGQWPWHRGLVPFV